MKLIPNKFDVRIRKKFKKTLDITDKEIEKHLSNIKEEPENAYSWVSLDDLGENMDSPTTTPESTPPQPTPDETTESMATFTTSDVTH